MPGLYDNPNDMFVDIRIPAEATAGNADEWAVWRAPANCTITAATWIPDVAVTGVVTNNFALAVNNATQAATVTTAKTYANGTNSVALTPEALTVAGAGGTVVANDVITFKRTVNGTGLASPQGALKLTFRLR